MAQIQIDDNVKKEAEQIAREMGYKIVLGSKGEFGSKFIPDAVRAFPAASSLLEACEAAYRAIVLGNGREIDWDAIADQLRDAMRKAKEPEQS